MGKRRQLTYTEKLIIWHMVNELDPAIDSAALGKELGIHRTVALKAMHALAKLGYVTVEKLGRSFYITEVSDKAMNSSAASGKAPEKPPKKRRTQKVKNPLHRSEASEMEAITELVKPRPWETTYDAVKALVTWIHQQKILKASSKKQ